MSGSEIENDYENLHIVQEGSEVFSSSHSNRAVRDFKSINALDHLYILLPGKTDFWYDLSDFPMKNGKFEISAKLKATRCAELFDSTNPRWIVTPGHAVFEYDGAAK